MLKKILSIVLLFILPVIAIFFIAQKNNASITTVKAIDNPTTASPVALNTSAPAPPTKVAFLWQPY